jgi:hypothetical protein
MSELATETVGTPPPTAAPPSINAVEAMRELASESTGTAPPLAAPPSAGEVEA